MLHFCWSLFCILGRFHSTKTRINEINVMSIGLSFLQSGRDDAVRGMKKKDSRKVVFTKLFAFSYLFKRRSVKARSECLHIRDGKKMMIKKCNFFLPTGHIIRLSLNSFGVYFTCNKSKHARNWIRILSANFCGRIRGKLEAEKNPWSKKGNQEQSQPTYDASLQELNPGNIGGRQAVLHYPCSLNRECSFKNVILIFVLDGLSESQFLLEGQSSLQFIEKRTVLLPCKVFKLTVWHPFALRLVRKINSNLFLQYHVATPE